MLLLLLSGLALGQVPDGVVPVAAAAEVPEAFAAWAAKKGKPEQRLPCSPLFERTVLLCYRVYEGESRRWVTSDDLASWGVEEDVLRELIVERARAHAPSVLERRHLDGLPGTLLATTGDRWALAPLLHPELLAASLGSSTVLAAVPAEDMALAWAPGSADLDRATAIGVRELYEEQPGGVSPLVFRFLVGEGWAAWLEAVKPE